VTPGRPREIAPYAFGYMMAAKVSTGYVAEIGTMRIQEEIDALDVLGLDSIAYLCSTRLLASWLILPLVYGFAMVVSFVGSFISVVLQIGRVSQGGYLQLFWKFQSRPTFLFSGIKGMAMATFVVLVGCGNAGNLLQGSDVEVSGVTIGHVTGVRLHGNGAIAIQIDPGYAPLHTGASALPRTKTLLGEAYIELGLSTVNSQRGEMQRLLASAASVFQAAGAREGVLRAAVRAAIRCSRRPLRATARWRRPSRLCRRSWVSCTTRRLP
jgi:hypothetical protein